MPELPEVETIRLDLEKTIINKKIVSLKINKPKLIKNVKLSNFKKDLIDTKIVSINRIGKLLYLRLSSQKFLLIHLKMTGQLIFQDNKRIIAGGHNYPPIDDQLPNKYSHTTFHFQDGSALYFNDQRQFGYMKTVDRDELNKIIDSYGIEPLQKNFSVEELTKVFANRKSNIKSLLLNQKLISGLGNIYADEVCFACKIHPGNSGNSLTKKDIAKLHTSIEKIIANAIKYRGTTFKDYTDARGQKGNYSNILKVYGREGEECVRCKDQKIMKIKLAGRGTHLCPKCQTI
ncbi:bifunctional DNA-formamidopyrimidine glycosylase/DNA-(apurinic or apyrimidinic site) lyase [Patescibacteria group bacterium]|nr:bifunctional DNA-formamidopyrimidine glycosylase/DNA-(apurinic or apyrimidinic site) lyase [Patescibacteria group bacterium]MCG2687375.1 bifunctional DNA-formamidopyrimidine glycosylase/DNA-(apurinic or apyrimidinic site) lyase [Candidatus Parcubacteria bacterium]